MSCKLSSVRVSSRLWLWYVPALVGCSAAALFGVGFWLALRGTAGEPLGSAPPPPAASRIAKPAGRRVLLVIGDSLARGTGDEQGRGFATDVSDLLSRRGPVDLVNLGVNGAESADVRTSVESASFRAIAATADWILLSAGGNDLSHAVPAAASAPVEAVEQVGQARRRYLANLRAILSAMREANSSAPICLVGLYNPFGEDSSTSKLSASVILSWNAAAQETALAFPGVSVVPTFDIFFRRPERLAGDRFHPNRKGYELIAQRIFQDLSVEGMPGGSP
ncbi:MAG TPA: GDSL-type esterase/lipase family protein [Thermoanaerobaculia bacterium]|nr:GDSL-type esterase/lipase family protein [Thermoanaerobaculia bacterium]